MTKFKEKTETIRKEMEAVTTGICILLATVDNERIEYGVDKDFWFLGVALTGDLEALVNTAREFQNRVYRQMGPDYEVTFRVVEDQAQFRVGSVTYVE